MAHHSPFLRGARCSAFAGAILLAALAGAATSPDSPRSLALPEGALVAPGPPADLELLFTGDVIGFVEDCGCHLNPAGGLPRRTWLIHQIRTNYPETPLVLLDTGNTADVPTDAGQLRTRALRETMAKLGYKAIGVGDHDLSLGYDAFQKEIAGIDVPFVSTNIVKAGTLDPVLPQSTIVEANGRDGKPVRIGVLSVTRFNPVWQKAGPSGANLAIAEPLPMIKAVLPRVRAQSDVVVLLASMPKDDVHELAKQLPDLDMILASYGGIASASEEAEGRVRIYYAGNQGKWIGESRIRLDAKRRPSDIVTYMHLLGAEVPKDKDMQDFVAGIVAKAGRAGGEGKKPGTSAPPPGAH